MANYNIKSADSGSLESNQTGVMSEIFKKSIPEGDVISTNYGALSDPLFRFYTLDTFSGNNSKTTFSLNDEVVENPRMSSADGDVVAYVDGDKTNDITVDYANNEVTFGSAPSSGTDNVEIFYLFGGGSFEVVVESNDQGGKEDVILSESINSAHLVDQLDNPLELDTAHMEKPNNLVVRYRGQTEIATDSRAPAQARIPFKKNQASEEEVEQYQDNIGSGV